MGEGSIKRGSDRVIRAAVWRGSCYFGLWVTLIGVGSLDLLVGVAAATIAAWVSIRLQPPGEQGLQLAALPWLAVAFMGQSFVAGLDVARRAFSPALPLCPGFLLYATRLPRGLARTAFASVSSLLPGTVVIRDDALGLLYHCLDTAQPVRDEIADDEAAFMRLLPPAETP